jgi:2-polyprenyl-3-methyl-5-hydroxy-6-metoxy-1,4-benzoquinol methylase
MKSFQHRDQSKEILDDLEIQGAAVSQNLKELDIINTFLGGNGISVSALKKVIHTKKNKTHWTIADLGCGSGQLMLEMNQLLKKHQLTSSFTGMDANPFIVQYAQKHCASDTCIKIIQHNVLQDTLTETYDVIHASLFLHHFTESELVQLLKKIKDHTSVALVINDLHRHPIAYYAIKLLTHWFSKSYLVKNDAALSVAKGFTKTEWEEILQLAGYKQYKIKWVWAFRHQIIAFPHHNS